MASPRLHWWSAPYLEEYKRLRQRSQWWVDYYQLNASVSHVGDAAIVVLLQRNADLNASQLWLVRSLVMIDGGNGREVAKLIVTTLGKIKAKFKMTTDPQFDAIVISHWDFVRNQALCSKQGDTDLYRIIASAIYFLSDEDNWNTTSTPKKHKYLKYNGNTPASRLYCQAFKAPYSNKKYVTDRLASGTTQQDDPFVGSVDMRRNGDTSLGWVTNTINVYHHLNKDLRGCNIFTGKFLSPTDISSTTSPLQLVKTNDPWTLKTTRDWQNAPGLYIVGVRKQYFSPPVKVNNLRSASNRPRVVNITIGKKIDINQESIICMLIWKDQANPDTAKPKLSLFTGGDAEWLMEDNVGAWIDSEVEVLKTGHHGSLRGTSKEFVTKIQPKHVLISAGDDHNHPDPVCYPYNLGYVDDPAYFKGVRFFVSKHKEVSRYKKPNPDVRPSGKTNQLWYDFFAYLEKNRPFPISEIRQRMTAADTWFTAPSTDPCSYAAVKQAWQTNRWDPINNLYIAAGSPISGPAYEKWKSEKGAWDDVSNDKKYRNYFEVNFVSFVVAKYFDGLSDVWNQYFPSPVDELNETVPGVVMDYQHVRFYPNKEPDFEIVPTPLPRSTTGAQALESNKKAKKAVLNARSESPPESQPTKQAQPQNLQQNRGTKNKRGADVPFNPFADVELYLANASYIMSLEQEGTIHDVEFDPDDVSDGDVEMASDDDDDNVNNERSLRAVPAETVAVNGVAAVVTQFQSIVSASSAVSGSAIALEDSSDQMNSYHFLDATQNKQLLFTDMISVAPTWNSATLDDDDDTYSWFWGFLSSPPQAANSITMTASGGTDIDDQSNSTVAFLNDINLTFSISQTSVSLSFKSTSILEGFSVDSVVNLADSYGFLENGPGLMLGLSAQNSSDGNFTLTDLLNLVGITDTLLDGSTQLRLCKTKQNKPNLPEPINGLWYYPQSNYKTIFTICAQPVNDPDNHRLVGVPIDIPGCYFSNGMILVTKSGYLAQAVDPDTNSTDTNDYVSSVGSFCIQTQLALGQPAGPNCQCWISVFPDGLSLTLQWGKNQSPSINDFLAWVADSAGVKQGSAWSDFQDICGHILGDLHLREAALVITKVNNAWVFGADFSMTLEVDLGGVDWGMPKDVSVPIMLKFEYKSADASGTGTTYVGFTGNLWVKVTDAMVALDRLAPNASIAPRLTPLPANAQYYINLLDLAGFDKNIVGKLDGLIPTYITALSFELSTDKIAFAGTMVANPSSDASFSPPANTVRYLVFDRVSISAAYTFPSVSSGKKLAFYFDALIVLNPRGDDPLYSASLDVSMNYNNGTWTFSGLITNLNVGCLYSLFPGSDNDAIMNVMEEITIIEFDVTYIYSTPQSSQIKAGGVLELGPVTLQIEYTRGVGGQDNWTFEASLGVDYEGGGMLLGDFLSGAGAEIAELLPDFVYNTPFIISDQTGREVDQDAPIRLKCEKFQDYFVLSIIVKANDFEFYFVQLTDSEPNQVKKPKRMLRFEVNDLPVVDSVPLLDEFAQPFDQMDLIWANDDFTKGEIDFLNAEIFKSNDEKLTCKAAVTPNPDPTKQKDDVVLAKGVHFMVIVEQDNTPTAILDYVFGGTPVPPDNDADDNQALESFSEDPPLQDDPPPPPAPTGSANSPWTRTIGPLTISSIGLKYLDKKLQLTLDATVKFSGVEVKFKGFGLRFPLESAASFIQDPGQVELLLDGMGISLNRPPLVIAGFIQKITDGYAGGIAVEFEPYTFLAMGGYLNYTQTKTNAQGLTITDTFKSILVILEVAGPIAELEFASLDGLTGGYGYNSQMRFPAVNEVTTHPFLSSSQVVAPSGDGNMLATMTSLTSGSKPWFSPSNGPMWVAGGLTAGLFQILDVDAVLAIDISADVKIAIFADCQAAIPAAAKNDSERFAFVELGLIMILDYAKGSFTCQGQLTPKSYILSKDCHLSGGFALCYWFEGSGHNGDWVFTVGGYHSQYSPPTWYPKPPRLAIDWKYDDTISIHGEAYFAITPKVCMGGGRLSLVFQDGSIGAHLEAWADFLINYKPFMFMATMGVTVGASYTFKHWGITKKFEVSIGCDLELHGPPVAGTVHVDWHIVSFTIHFGNSKPASDAVDWAGFTALLLQNPTSAAKVPTVNSLHILATTGGVLPADVKDPPPTYWAVDASTFTFQFASMFPIIRVVKIQNNQTVALFTSDKAAPHMKPMHVTSNISVVSDVTMTITDSKGNDVSDYFTMSPIVKKVPTAIWGAYDSSQDPSGGARPASLLSTDNATMDEVMGFDIGPCNKTESADLIQVDIATDNSEDVFSDSLNPPILPNSLYVPTSLPSPITGQPIGFMSSVDPSMTQYQSCVSSRVSWVPDFSSDNLPNASKLSVLTSQILKPRSEVGIQDIVKSWIAFKALDPSIDGSSGQAYQQLGANATPLTSVCEPFKENDSLPPPRIAVAS